MLRPFLFGSVFVFFLHSCGIKASTQPLQPPVVEIKRLGEVVYLRSLEGEVIPEGFEKKEVGWVKKSAQGFCFKVERVEGKSSNQCVGGLLEQEPAVKIDYFLKSLSFLKETKRWEQPQDTFLSTRGGIGGPYTGSR
jgi:hypothetical protein